MTARIHDDTPCTLGEGPLWHPTRGQLYWFDILRQRLLTRTPGGTQSWSFPDMVSAAGWVSDTELLIASETRLFRFDLDSGRSEDVCALDADDPGTRSNDGRADPWGGFWIGTMGKGAEIARGAIWRWYRGELRKLHPGITIPNAICFSPDRAFAHFADSLTRRIHRQRLDPADGWPAGDPELWLDLEPEGLVPDGAVFDAEGNLWNAQWGAARVACYSPEGTFLRAVEVPARHSSCPAFGGPDLATLYVTSARQGLSEAILAAEPQNGLTFAVEGAGRGLPEHRVTL